MCRRDRRQGDHIRGSRRRDEGREGELKDVMSYDDQPIVSSDIIGETHSSIFDALAGIALNGHFMKLCAWYDNEYGFTCNMMRLLAHIASVRGE